MGIEMGTERSIRSEGVRELSKIYAVLGRKIIYRKDGYGRSLRPGVAGMHA